LEVEGCRSGSPVVPSSTPRLPRVSVVWRDVFERYPTWNMAHYILM
jgi:hypothetical protein